MDGWRGGDETQELYRRIKNCYCKVAAGRYVTEKRRSSITKPRSNKQAFPKTNKQLGQNVTLREPGRAAAVSGLTHLFVGF
ncbi:hypothetical protein LDENG_00166060 [Lucifuga dentata]|nr:hypothetical protein LDENG_00166060 [Lucifuga dentata]